MLGSTGIAVPSYLVSPSPRAQQVRKVSSAGDHHWTGILIARTFPDGFTEDEYRLLLVGGSRRKLAKPDRWVELEDGARRPHYVLSAYERRMRDTLLNRLCLDGYESHNVACNAGRAVILNMLTGGVDTGVTYFAVGSGSSTSGALASDTQLWTESFRKAIGTSTVSGNQVDYSTVFNTGEANSTYTEAGLFGNGATGSANTGSLFNHAPYVYTKTNTVQLTNDVLIFFN